MKILIQPIHPFPARMAPEIAIEEASSLPKESLILDPMVGSGTVMRIIAEQGHRGIALDMDPLSILMTKVWTSPVSPQTLRDAAEETIRDASLLVDDRVSLPWVDHDEETKSFIDFWFAKQQQLELRKLSFILQKQNGAIGDALRVALSRLIITKDRGASLARDVSHSRPHRVKQTNDYSVMPEFRRSTCFIASRLEKQPPPGNVTVTQGDARQLVNIGSSTIDAIITSPPYLNAIDYMRGHKLSLVWLGYKIRDLRLIRQDSIGTERGLGIDTNIITNTIYQEMPNLSMLPVSKQRIVKRYIFDITATICEFYRVLKPRGKAVLVIGNSCIKGTFIDNSLLTTLAAQHYGFTPHKCFNRELPPSKRYLPPPSDKKKSALERRMRTETVLTLIHP